MNVLLFSEKEKIIKSVSEAVESSSHKLMTVDLSALSNLEDLSEIDVVIMDKKSWQRCAVLFKYFGIISALNQKPLLVLANDSKAKTLKFRDSNCKTETQSVLFKTEDFLFTLESTINEPADTLN